ncbi:hypothetical protein BY996DRAFT_503426 [Phakopsora pachyrhizi]|uniref:Expressed protein n=1 Tax=Phakopsora pachyrhizi TaxID=170000 RepID=A0AAV0BMY2_PHAPC|nr:hypothetical protein BY996DRAFT_503426 [Phakopsora pachyrhizi]CAH7686932.1 expressed protein [Phakopsora pachyrhizi]
MSIRKMIRRSIFPTRLIALSSSSFLSYSLLLSLLLLFNGFKIVEPNTELINSINLSSFFSNMSANSQNQFKCLNEEEEGYDKINVEFPTSQILALGIKPHQRRALIGQSTDFRYSNNDRGGLDSSKDFQQKKLLNRVFNINQHHRYFSIRFSYEPSHNFDLVLVPKDLSLRLIPSFDSKILSQSSITHEKENVLMVNVHLVIEPVLFELVPIFTVVPLIFSIVLSLLVIYLLSISSRLRNFIQSNCILSSLKDD